MKNWILFFGLLSFVLFVNHAIISFDMMYAEQPLIFAANSGIHSLSDLLTVYLHPKMLNIFSVPFFRPSGHFLIYQIMLPFLGWHNTQALIILNLVFLALSGFTMIKIYELLFPGFTIGGYIAFAIFLMHPALMLSRLIILHFEFAYVFFTLLSLYWFIRFCQSRAYLPSPRYSTLAASLFFFAFAVTLKEPALMLGPALAVYLCLSSYHGQPVLRFIASLLRNKQLMEILALVTLLSLSLALYMTLAWPSLEHPLRSAIDAQERISAAKELLNNILPVTQHLNSRADLAHADLVWRTTQFTAATQIILWVLSLSLVFSLIKTSLKRFNKRDLACQETLFIYKKSLLFLFIGAALFLILPISWGMGLPWHLSLTLVFLSMIWGYSYDYLSSQFIKNQRWNYALGSTLVLVIGLSTLAVNRVNIDYTNSKIGFPLTLSHNAVFQAPPLQDKLNAESVLVVEDSFVRDGYALGDSGYPLYLMNISYERLQKVQDYSYFKYQARYNGFLFKWAYLMPNLQEEVFPFYVDRMDEVPDATIHSWLSHFNNIFCVGYNKQGKWLDKTAEFKRDLLIQKAKRLLLVHEYEPYAATTLNGRILYTKRLDFPDYPVCQYICDQNVQCKGFTYESAEYHYQPTIRCLFYDSVSMKDTQFCPTCIGFLKASKQ